MAQKNKQGLIVNVSYTKDEVRKPIMTKVIVEKIENLPGSTTGAGSGDFHQYRNLKRIEDSRLELMELEYREKKIKEEFEEIKEMHKQKILAAKNKRALKRQRKKIRKKRMKEMFSEGNYCILSENKDELGDLNKGDNL